MKTWIVRFVSLYVFNVLVLLLIGLILPTVAVGWSALWGSVILTAATIWVKPAIGGWFRSLAARKGSAPSTGARKATEYIIVFLVALVVWFLVVLLTGVDVRGWFWGYLLPPVFLLAAWAVYDGIDDMVEARAGDVYDKVESAVSGNRTQQQAAPPVQTPEERAATESGRTELKDGLTPDQRKMFDDL